MQRAMIAACGLFAALAVTPAAHAVPLAKPQASPQGIVTQVAPGRGPGGPGGAMSHPGAPGRFMGGGGPGPRMHGPRVGGVNHHHHHGPRFRGLYAPFVGYGAYYGYREGCGWLRRRAEATGSPYWWRRYEDCVDDNY